MGRTISSNNQQNYNVSNVFNDYDAFCCNTPTTYYKINQFAFVSHTNKNCDVPADELTRSNADTPPFADYENNDPFSQHQLQHQPSPLRISIPRQVMGPIKASVFNQAPSLNIYNNQKVLANQLKLSRPPVQAIPQASYNVENDEQEAEEEEATEALNSQDDQQQVEVQEAPVAQQKPIVMTIAAPQQATPAKKAVVAEEEDEEFVEKEDDEEDYQQEDEDEEDDDEDFVEEKVEKPTRATKNSNKKASKKAAKKTPVKTRKDDKPVAASSSVAAASSAHQQEGPIQVTIKPARKTRSNFISFFPEKLYCAPYKYDVRVRFSASESHEKYNNMIESGDYQTLLFKLLDGETHKPIKSNSKGDKALTVEKCKKSDLMNEEGEDHDDQAHHANEVVYRLCFNVCSFHNHRKPFVIQCTEKNSELLLFESNPFHIYARKNNKDKNGSDQWGDEVPAESVKTLFSGLENEEQTAGSEDAMDSKEEDNEKTVTASKRSREEDGNSDEKKSSKKKQKTLRIQLPAQFQKQAGEFSNVE